MLAQIDLCKELTWKPLIVHYISFNTKQSKKKYSQFFLQPQMFSVNFLCKDKKIFDATTKVFSEYSGKKFYPSNNYFIVHSRSITVTTLC